MRKGILGIIALVGVVLFSNQGMATGVLGDLKDDIDEQCVINCLQDDGQSSGECKRADVIACRETCHLPPTAIFSLLGQPFNPDLEHPSKIQGMFAAALASLGLVEGKDAKTVIAMPTNNPLADLGIAVPAYAILTLLPPNTQPFNGPDLSNAVVAQGEIPCMVSKTFTYDSGLTGIGCREIKKNGTAGWAAKGCGATAPATGPYYGNYSSFCCNALGRACPTCPLVAGEGVCSVNSTPGGDGIY